MAYQGPSLWKRFRIWWRTSILRSHPEQTTRWVFKFNRTQIDDDLRRKLEADIRAHDPAFLDTNLGGDGIPGYEVLAEELGYYEFDQDKAAKKWRRIRFTGRFWCGELTVDDTGQQHPGEKGEEIDQETYKEWVEKFYRLYGHRPF
jgi:hypothetical protein